MVTCYLLALQVAAQQGAYLSSCFSRRQQCQETPEGPLRFRDSGRHHFRPFRYAITFPLLILFYHYLQHFTVI